MEISQVLALEGVLILGIALPSTDLQLCSGLQIEGRAGYLGELWAQARNHPSCGYTALGEGF